jgi:hypothetical protein
LNEEQKPFQNTVILGLSQVRRGAHVLATIAGGQGRDSRATTRRKRRCDGGLTPSPSSSSMRSQRILVGGERPSRLNLLALLPPPLSPAPRRREQAPILARTGPQSGVVEDGGGGDEGR